MKRNYFMLTAASMFLLSACSNDEDITKGIETDNSVQELVLKVASSGDGLVTRAGRPLYSSAAAQNIEKVTLIIYDKTNPNAIKKVTSIATWMTASSEYTTNGHGRQHTISFKGNDKLDAGTYAVFATGYTTTGSAYTFTPTLPTSATGNFATQTVITSDEAEEIFAGEIAELTVNAEKSFNVTTGGKENVLTLHRQVAGSFGYFMNIPAAVDGKDAATLRLVATGKNLKAKFENFNSAFTDNTSGNIKHIVNGETPATANAKFAATATTSANDAHIVYSIALSDWFTADATSGKLDKNSDGILDKNDTWKNGIGGTYHGVQGSVFAGEFVIPFALAAGVSTMELQLLAANGDIIKHWGISIPSADVATGKNSPEVSDESVSVFNVVRNHMYNVGVKIKNDGTTDPTDPTPDVDVPEDLSKGQDIILKVNDNWEALHQLVID